MFILSASVATTLGLWKPLETEESILDSDSGSTYKAARLFYINGTARGKE